MQVERSSIIAVWGQGGEIWSWGVIALKLSLDAVVITVQATLALLASSAIWVYLSRSPLL